MRKAKTPGKKGNCAAKAPQDAGKTGFAAEGKKPGFLKAAYNAIPTIPFFDRTASATVYASILIFIAFVGVTLLTMPPLEFSEQIIEAALHKNSPLRLEAGETYVYSVQVENGTAALSYRVEKRPGCGGLLVLELQSGASECVDSLGNAAGSGSNLSLGNSSFTLFSPWMLAASDDFSWTANTTLSAGFTSVELPLYFRSNGAKSVAGRQAFDIEIAAGGPGTVPPEYAPHVFVDTEKRIALAVSIGNLTTRLVSAPFQLNWSDG